MFVESVRTGASKTGGLLWWMKPHELSPFVRLLRLGSWMTPPTSVTPSSTAASAKGNSTNGPVVYSIIWSFPPTSYSRLFCVGFGISSACETWPKCSCCVASNSPTKRCGIGKSASHPCLPSTSVANVKGRLDGAGTWMRRT